MLQIRFNRIGKKNRAIFRIVLQEHTIAPGGKHIEILGSWDPHQKKGVFDSEKIKGWITKGAQVTDSVWNLLIKENIIEGKKRAVKINKPAETKAEGEGVAATEAKKDETAEPVKEEIKGEEAKAQEPKSEEAKDEVKNEKKKDEKKTKKVKSEEPKKEEPRNEEKKPEKPKKE